MNNLRQRRLSSPCQAITQSDRKLFTNCALCARTGTPVSSLFVFGVRLKWKFIIMEFKNHSKFNFVPLYALVLK